MNRFQRLVQELAAKRRGKLTSRLALMACLGIVPTGVLAYAEVIPGISALIAGLDGGPSLPGVARQVASGEGLKIVAFGSSSTEGVGASAPSKSYPALLEAALGHALPDLDGGVTVINRGIGGQAVDEMLARLDRDVLAEKPNLVIWQTGSNDPLRNVPLEHFRTATSAAVKRIREAGIDVILMEPQWCPKFDATPGAYLFRDAVREIGEDLDVPVIRRSELMQEWVADARVTTKELFAPDGLHMADAGYAMLAKAAAAEILRDADAMDTIDAETATALAD